MFNDSYLRAYMILRFVKKLDFAFLSLGGPSHDDRVWCLGRVPKHRNHWQEVQGLLFSPQNLIFCTTPDACRGSAVVEEAEAACEPAEVPEQCCSGWASSASGAGSTAPGSGAEASVSRYPGCSAPAAGQNRALCSPSDLNTLLSRIH